MAVPSTVADLDTTAANNAPSGSDSPNVIDDHIRAISAIIKQNVSKGADIASSSTITIPDSGSYFIVNGVATINSINNCWNGRVVLLKFSGALTLTNSASLILFGTNITTAAGDTLFIVNESAGVWRAVAFTASTGGEAVTLSGAQTLTNKTLVAASNTITTTASGNLTATELNAALAELQGDIDTRSTTSHNHAGVYEPIMAAASQAEMEAGAVTAIRSMSPLRVKQAIDALASVTFASSAENVAGTVEDKAVDPLGIREAFNAAGSAPVFACRAWVNFNGEGTISIRGSGNVSSVTDNGIGDYTVNFAEAMPDANYATTISGEATAGAYFLGMFGVVNGGAAAGSVRIRVLNNTSQYDFPGIHVAAIR